jgi:2-polyprenyl-3-methyl-5-hydroxy-6-metoxy-1,4-benzoquinol methylase
VSVLGCVEDQVVEAFGHGRGVPYSAYRRFHQVMAEDSAQRVVSVLLSDILPLDPRLPARLEAGADVLDVGCGAGGALIAMAAAFRRSRFTGYDIAADALACGRAEAARRGLRNVRFERRDAADAIEPRAFDLVTAIDAIHDQAKPANVLSNVAAALRPGGTFFMVDVRASSHHHKNIALPLGTFLYTMSCMHCMSVSLAGGGPGLGAAWGEELALQMLREAGFASVRVEHLEGDVLNNYYIATLDPA